MIVLEPVCWPAPPQVGAVSTTRLGGGSSGPYAGANLGLHVGDDPVTVEANRSLLMRQLGLAVAPTWLNQVHGTAIVNAAVEGGVEADASWSREPGRACVVMTADCLPLLLCNRQGSWVAAVHAGWRGLQQGIIEAGIAAYPGEAADLLAWLGPAIGPAAFEVGGEVRTAFVDALGAVAKTAFMPCGERFMADLFALARLRLARAGVTAVYGGSICTFSNAQRYYSYRRDGVTGRQATLIWLR